MVGLVANASIRKDLKDLVTTARQWQVWRLLTKVVTKFMSYVLQSSRLLKLENLENNLNSRESKTKAPMHQLLRMLANLTVDFNLKSLLDSDKIVVQSSIKTS